jgi:hypothetical protein
MPHLTYAQHISYTYQMPTYQVWDRLAAEGKLNKAQSKWFSSTKPLEELYDTQSDPYQINNLADRPEAKDILERMRAVHLEWLGRTRDLGFLPEYDMLSRSQGSTPYEMARDQNRYPQKRVLVVADLTGRGEEKLVKLIESISDSDPAVRYWAAVSLSALGPKAGSAAEQLRSALTDPSPNVRIAAAETLWRLDGDADVLPVLIEGIRHENPWIRLRAANVLDLLGEKSRPALADITQAKSKPDLFNYANRAFDTILADLAR